MVVDFDKWAGELVRERKWHRSQQLTELPDGGVRLQLRLNNLAEVERWILSWGIHATVQQPQRLRETIRSASEKLASRYRDEAVQKIYPLQPADGRGGGVGCAQT